VGGGVVVGGVVGLVGDEQPIAVVRMSRPIVAAVRRIGVCLPRI
jgi:hypothetical protein